MHMADALISPTVGAVMWATSTGIISYSVRKVKKEIDDSRVPLMGVLGAFIFAAQMINFSIPATGASGHLGGALMLTILLGPYAAFLTMASILTIQALFFADGGLLALGCNIFNLAFFPCFITYPFIYKSIIRDSSDKRQIFIGATVSAVVGLQLGSFAVVLETFLSGISELPFNAFLLLMQPIHLAIGLIEGLITAAVIVFILKERPELAYGAGDQKPIVNSSLKPLLVGILAVTLLTGGVLSWFASSEPDGLEWSIQKASVKELGEPAGIYSLLMSIQKKTAVFPEYNLKESEAAGSEENKAKEDVKWPGVDGGLSTAGIVGSLLTLVMAGSSGKLLQALNKRNTL